MDDVRSSLQQNPAAAADSAATDSWDSLSFNLRKSTTSSGVDLIPNHYPPPPPPLLPHRAHSASPQRPSCSVLSLASDETPPPLLPRSAGSSTRGRAGFIGGRQRQAGDSTRISDAGLTKTNCATVLENTRPKSPPPPLLALRGRESASPRRELNVSACSRLTTASHFPRESLGTSRNQTGNHAEFINCGHSTADRIEPGLRKIRFERGSSDPAEYNGRLKQFTQSNSPTRICQPAVGLRHVGQRLIGGSERTEVGGLSSGETVEIQNNLDNLSIDAARRRRDLNNAEGCRTDRSGRVTTSSVHTGGMTPSQVTPLRAVTPQRSLAGHLEQTGEDETVGQAVRLQLVVPLDRWPLRGTPPQHQHQHQQPETHFSLERILSKPRQVSNEYVEDPSGNTTNKPVNSDVKEHSENFVRHFPPPPTPSQRDCMSNVVTEQPKKKDFTTNIANESSGIPGKPGADETRGAEVEDHECGTRFVCPRCGRCRCAYCTGSSSSAEAALPSCWIANGRYECGARTCVDCMSCVCCVRTIFYHCLYDEDDDVDIVARPFAGYDGPHCCARWTLIGALVPVMPCLLLYPLLQCAVGALARCRWSCARRRRRGCHCNSAAGDAVAPPGGRTHDAPSSSSATATASSSSGTTRSLLLDSAENSSA